MIIKLLKLLETNFRSFFMFLQSDALINKSICSKY